MSQAKTGPGTKKTLARRMDWHERLAHKAWKLHKDLYNIKGAHEDVHCANFFKHCSPLKEEGGKYINGNTDQKVKKGRTYIVDRGAFLQMMGEGSLSAQKRNS